MPSDLDAEQADGSHTAQRVRTGVDRLVRIELSPPLSLRLAGN